MRPKTIVVHIKANEGAKLILSNIKSESSNHTIEIHIGMERSYYHRIFENRVKVWDTIDQGLLRADQWVSFVVSWESDVLTLFKKGYQLPEVLYKIKDPFNINFFGIASEL
jgi:hypothetical protein